MSVQSVALRVVLFIATIGVLGGCQRAEQTAGPAGSQPQVDQSAGDERPLEQVMEFDGFTLRANVTRTEFLPDAMARQYGIQADPDSVLLNVVIMENRPDRQPAPMSAEVTAKYENRIGQVQVIDMRAAEANGFVSYIGTLDASAQRVFRLVIEAQPAGVDEPLLMDFEVQLDTLATE